MKKANIVVLLVIGVVMAGMLSSCNKDDGDGDSGITITNEIILGTWENTSENISLVISEDGIGLYTSEYYSNPSEVIAWEANGSKLEVQGTGTFAQTYVLKTETTLENYYSGKQLTKK